MVIRESNDGRAIVSTQEDHAELAAQFAAHWGNERFSKLRPYRTMVFATTFHDSGYREFEGNPPINPAKGRPYSHREEIPGFEPVELQAYARNVAWVGSHDRYAGLLVSMHRTGLWQNRYGVFTQPPGRIRERSAAVQALKKELERKQEEDRKAIAAGDPLFEQELDYNYRALQVYDLLSLYFCCDGHDGNGGFKEFVIAPVPIAYGSHETVELRLAPAGPNAVKLAPYPFDAAPLAVSVRARIVEPPAERTEEAGLEAYQRAPRTLLTYSIVEG